MQMKIFSFARLFQKQQASDESHRTDNGEDNKEQRDKKRRRFSLKKIIRCLEDAEDPVIMNTNAQNLIKPNTAPNACTREDSRIRDWLLDSARYATPPATPHCDPSQKDSAASEFSKATTTASQPNPCSEPKEVAVGPGVLQGAPFEDQEEARPVLAKLIGSAATPQPKIAKEHEHEVLFSRRTAPSRAKPSGSRARPAWPPTTARDDVGRSGAAVTSDMLLSPPRAAEQPRAAASGDGGPGEGWTDRGWTDRGWWPELLSSPVTCSRARRSPMPTSP